MDESSVGTNPDSAYPCQSLRWMHAPRKCQQCIVKENNRSLKIQRWHSPSTECVLSSIPSPGPELRLMAQIYLSATPTLSTHEVKSAAEHSSSAASTRKIIRFSCRAWNSTPQHITEIDETILKNNAHWSQCREQVDGVISLSSQVTTGTNVLGESEEDRRDESQWPTSQCPVGMFKSRWHAFVEYSKISKDRGGDVKHIDTMLMPGTVQWHAQFTILCMI